MYIVQKFTYMVYVVDT